MSPSLAPSFALRFLPLAFPIPEAPTGGNASAAGVGRKLPVQRERDVAVVRRDRIVHGDEFGAVREGSLHLYLDEDVGHGGEHVASTEHPPAAIHEVRHAEILAVCAVAYEFEEDGCDERGGLGVVETNAAREAFLRERARGVKRELVHLSGRETHRRRRTRPGRGLGLGAGRGRRLLDARRANAEGSQGAELAHAGARDAKGEGSLAKRGGVGDALGKGREELPDRGEAFGAEGPRVPNARARTRGRIGLGERGERGGDARLPGAGRVTPATTRGHAEVLRETTGRRWRRRWGSAPGPRARRAPTRGHAGGRGDDEHRRGFPGKDVRQGTGFRDGEGTRLDAGSGGAFGRGRSRRSGKGGSRGSADTRRMADESETTLLMPRAGRCANRKRRIRGDVRTRKKKADKPFAETSERENIIFIQTDHP